MIMKSEEVEKGTERYLVKYYITSCWGDQNFAMIGPKGSLKIWLEDGSLRDGDEIYEITFVGTVKAEKTLKIVP